MYQIEQGILTRDGKKQFALGQSYYPSFHKSKYPVPPEGDRVGEMKKDLAHMARLGFNHVRFAALGLCRLDDSGKLVIDTPFVDAMIREAEKLNISVSVRLQGYAVNLRDFKDVAMVDQHGTETANYENGVRAITFLKAHNDLLVNARRCHQGVGILHSDFANYLCDARENDDEGRMDALHNSHMLEFAWVYRQLREAGFSVTVTDGEHLDRNPLGIRVLYVTDFTSLSEAEKMAVERFIVGGGQVYTVNHTYGRTWGSGFRPYRPEPLPYEQRVYDPVHSAHDMGAVTGIAPLAVSLDPGIGVQVLEEGSKKLLVLTNISTQRSTIDAAVRLSFPAKTAAALAMDGEKEAILSDGMLTVKGITDGAIIVVE